ncbi:hypothetical protein H4R34_003079 [Dimargaris verticillata]|uniref:DUF423-domain-containing protein n=1 Tax=Dimargaris verticillata TaxID=2761393 RepID=A0A9W8B6S1_9FUNG|nr:hypothetical protein H4R34_003079 [Dimargaris verticillata]
MASLISHTLFWRLGCVLGASGVGLGAYGSHGFPRQVNGDEQRVGQWRTAVQYQMMHSLALLAAAYSKRSLVASAFLASGTVLFSGTLYLRALNPDQFSGLRRLAPTGGMLLIFGWLALAV